MWGDSFLLSLLFVSKYIIPDFRDLRHYYIHTYPTVRFPGSLENTSKSLLGVFFVRFFFLPLHVQVCVFLEERSGFGGKGERGIFDIFQNMNWKISIPNNIAISFLPSLSPLFLVPPSLSPLPQSSFVSLSPHPPFLPITSLLHIWSLLRGSPPARTLSWILCPPGGRACPRL